MLDLGDREGEVRRRVRIEDHQLRHLLVSSSLLGPVDLPFRARSGRLKFTVRRHKFYKDSSLLVGEVRRRVRVQHHQLRHLLVVAFENN